MTRVWSCRWCSSKGEKGPPQASGLSQFYQGPKTLNVRVLPQITCRAHWYHTWAMCQDGSALWPRLPLCPRASRPESGWNILYLEDISLMAKATGQNKPDNHCLSLCSNVSNSHKITQPASQWVKEVCDTCKEALQITRLLERWGTPHGAGSKRSHQPALVWSTSTTCSPTSLLVSGFSD